MSAVASGVMAASQGRSAFLTVEAAAMSVVLSMQLASASSQVLRLLPSAPRSDSITSRFALCDALRWIVHGQRR